MKQLRVTLGMGAVVALVAMQAAVQAAPTAAAPGRPACGTAISANTTLAADVGPCPGVGLLVVADNVTLNLNGHRVFGTAAQGAFPGIVLPSRTGVKVTGPGSVDGFDAGVLIGAGSRNTVRNLWVHDNFSNQFVADNPAAGQLGDGILMFSSSNNTIASNTVTHNGPFSGIAIASFTDENQGLSGPAPTGNLLQGNTVADNNVPELCALTGTTTEYPGTPCTPRTPVFNQDIGIRVEGPVAVRNTVKGNTVSNSGREGISILNTVNPDNPPSSDNSLVANISRHNGFTGSDFQGFVLSGDGIELRCFSSSVPSGCSQRTFIQGNRVTDNSAAGIGVGQYSFDNTITGNHATGNNALNVGATSFDRSWDGEDDNLVPPCDHNTWRGNVLGTGNQPCVGALHTEPPAAPAAGAAAAAQSTGPAPGPRAGTRASIAGR